MTTEELYHKLMTEPYGFPLEQISRLTTYQLSYVISGQEAPPRITSASARDGGDGDVDPPEWEGLNFRDYYLVTMMSKGKSYEEALALYERRGRPRNEDGEARRGG